MATAQLRLWLGFLLIGFSDFFANSQMQTFSCADLSYIRPDLSHKSWSEAQTVCRNFSATLPIADTPVHQSCFVSALKNFNAYKAYSWIGANSSDGDRNAWRWLDGSLYQGRTVTSDGSYQQGYAYATRNNVSDIQFYAAKSTDKYPYICRYSNSDRTICINGSNQVAYIRDNFCFLKYNESLSWFSARNNCLSNNGDLAYFPDISVLSNIIDTGMWWIGLRSISWNWIGAASEDMKEVTFTQWKNGQPNGDFPQCISTDEADNTMEYFSWRDYDCLEAQIFICQLSSQPLSTPPQQPVSNNPSSTSSTSSLSSLLSQSTYFPSISSLSSSSLEAGAWSNADTSLSTVFPSNTGEIAHADNSIMSDNKVALGVGIGVGVGVPILIAIILIIVLLIWRRRRKSSKQESPDSKKTNHSISDVVVVMHPSSPENAEMAKSDENEAAFSKARHSNTSLRNPEVPAEETPKHSSTSFQDPTDPTDYAPVYSVTSTKNTVVPKEDTHRHSSTSFQDSADPTHSAPEYSHVVIQNQASPREDTAEYNDASFQDPNPTRDVSRYSNTSFQDPITPAADTTENNTTFEDPVSATEYVTEYGDTSFQDPVAATEYVAEYGDTSFQDPVAATEYVTEYGDTSFQDPVAATEYVTEYGDTSFQDPVAATEYVTEYGDTSFQDPDAPTEDTPEYGDTSFQDPVAATEYVTEYGDTSFQDPDAPTEDTPDYGDTSFQDPRVPTEDTPEYVDTEF